MVGLRLVRDRLLAPAAAVGVAAIAWAALATEAVPPLPEPAAVFLMWNAMMVAMMLPSLAPWLGAFPPRHAAAFALGYLSVWSVYCAAATLIQLELGGALGLRSSAAGLLFVGAGAFQLTPLKASCLLRCRSPLGQVLAHWRGGRSWALEAGARHGANCLGCCWALMALAFVLGVMNLGFMAVLTLVMAGEKLLPGGPRFARALGVVLLLAGTATLLVA